MITYTLHNAEVAVRRKEKVLFLPKPVSASHLFPNFQRLTIHAIFIVYSDTQYAVLLLAF